MMKTIFRIITVCLFIALAAVPAEGQSSYRDYDYRDYRDRDYRDRDPETVDLGAEVPRRNPERKRRLKRRLIAPKGDWQVGLSVTVRCTFFTYTIIIVMCISCIINFI